MKPDQEPRLSETCLHLRHKMMYVDERHAARGLVDDSSRTRIFHCAKTYEAFGPDGIHCSPTDCSTDRPCYCRGQCSIAS